MKKVLHEEFGEYANVNGNDGFVIPYYIELHNSTNSIMLVIGAIVTIVGFIFIFALFMPKYKTKNTEQQIGLNQYIGRIIYDASNPDELSSTNPEFATLDILMGATDSNPFGSVLNPENPKPVNYGRQTEPVVTESNDSSIEPSQTQILSPKDYATLNVLMTNTDSNPFGSVLNPENPKPVNYGRQTEPVTTESNDSSVEPSQTQILSPKDYATLNVLMTNTDSNPFGSVLNPENPKPVNYGRQTEPVTTESNDSSIEPSPTRTLSRIELARLNTQKPEKRDE